MPQSKLVLVAAVFSLIAVPVFGGPEHSAKVRKEYGENNLAPDHVVFASLLRAMELRAESDRVLALSIVQENMKFDSLEAAENFLQRMISARADLSRTKRVMNTAELCQDDSSRTDSDIYKAMDTLDDDRLVMYKIAYYDFISELNKDERRRLKAWLDDAKEGYSYVAYEHSSLFENRGVDVKTHVQQLCIRYAQEELARTQK